MAMSSGRLVTSVISPPGGIGMRDKINLLLSKYFAVVKMEGESSIVL